MAKEPCPVEELSLWDDAQAMITKARAEGIETVHERLQQQTPHCKFCKITPKAPRGVCGADAEVVVARNFGRFVAGGSAAHSDHGRDLIEVLEAIVSGETKDYKITDEPKLRRIAEEVGVAAGTERESFFW